MTAEKRVIMSAPHWGRTRDLPPTEPSPCILLPFVKLRAGFSWKGERGFCSRLVPILGTCRDSTPASLPYWKNGLPTTLNRTLR